MFDFKKKLTLIISSWILRKSAKNAMYRFVLA